MKFKEFEYFEENLSVRKIVEDNLEYFEEEQEIPENKKDELLTNLMNLVYDEYKSIKDNISYHIGMMYQSIIYIKYSKFLKNWDDIGDLDLFVSNYLVLYHKYHSIIKYDTEYIKNLCNSIYIEKRKYFYSQELLSEFIEEEFKPEHLLDLEYHLDNFEKWCNGDKEFINQINIYRQISLYGGGC